MADQFKLDPAEIEAGIRQLINLGKVHDDALTAWRNTLRQYDGCWGNDEMGKSFGENFTKSEQEVDKNVDGAQGWFTESGTVLKQLQTDFEDGDTDNAAAILNSFTNDSVPSAGPGQ